MLFIAAGNESYAQMFGERSVGGQGMLRGNERFLRGNRSPRDFVGADRTEQSGFVGSQQALTTGRVRPATEGFRLETNNPRRINRPIAPQPASGMYYPRLEVVWDRDAELDREVSNRTTNTMAKLYERIGRLGGSQAHIAINGSMAVLHGQVDSSRTAELLEQMLRFEPGIDEVRNELQIVPGT